MLPILLLFMATSSRKSPAANVDVAEHRWPVAGFVSRVSDESPNRMCVGVQVLVCIPLDQEDALLKFLDSIQGEVETPLEFSRIVGAHDGPLVGGNVPTLAGAHRVGERNPTPAVPAPSGQPESVIAESRALGDRLTHAPSPVAPIALAAIVGRLLSAVEYGTPETSACAMAALRAGAEYVGGKVL